MIFDQSPVALMSTAQSTAELFVAPATAMALWPSSTSKTSSRPFSTVVLLSSVSLLETPNVSSNVSETFATSVPASTVVPFLSSNDSVRLIDEPVDSVTVNVLRDL